MAGAADPRYRSSKGKGIVGPQCPEEESAEVGSGSKDPCSYQKNRSIKQLGSTRIRGVAQ